MWLPEVGAGASVVTGSALDVHNHCGRISHLASRFLPCYPFAAVMCRNHQTPENSGNTPPFLRVLPLETTQCPGEGVEIT